MLIHKKGLEHYEREIERVITHLEQLSCETLGVEDLRSYYELANVMVQTLGDTRAHILRDENMLQKLAGSISSKKSVDELSKLSARFSSIMEEAHDWLNWPAHSSWINRKKFISELRRLHQDMVEARTISVSMAKILGEFEEKIQIELRRLNQLAVEITTFSHNIKSWMG